VVNGFQAADAAVFAGTGLVLAVVAVIGSWRRDIAV
jgi:hypothetical protein